MRIFLRSAALAGAVLLAGVTSAQANKGFSDNVVKIGVLADMTGVFSDLSGANSVTAARMAIEDFIENEQPEFKIELVVADHQNKTDVAASRAREWFDVDGVDMITDTINSAVALAVSNVAREKNRVLMVTGSGSTALIHEQCSPNTILYAWDTYSIASSLGRTITRGGKKKWFFITVDYALGQAIEKDTIKGIEDEGGTVVGSLKHPINASDFSSFVLTAQSSGADVIGIANAGGDLINTVKAASEFGVSQTLAPMAGTLADVHSMGPHAAQGMQLVEGFYWDRDDESRAWSERFFKLRNRMPIMLQAGLYSAVTTYLKAVKEVGTDDPEIVLKQLKSMEINDFFARNGKIREDGRMVYDLYHFEVKSPREAKGPWDYYHLRGVIPGEQAFQPLSESRCELVANE